MLIVTLLILIGLLALAIPVAAGLGILGLSLSGIYSKLPLSLVGAGLREGSGVPQNVRPSRVEAKGQASRRAWFGDKHGWMDTPVMSRADLAETRTGPLIIDEYDTTCVVPPGARAERDSAGNIVITLAAT